MGIFDPPDIEKLRREADWPRLIHWSLYDKDPASSRAARAVLKADPYPVVEYLYETALWAQEHSIGRRKRLPKRSVMLLSEANRALTRVGSPAVAPLLEAVRLYDDYGDPDEHVRFLMLALVFDILEKIGRPAAGTLRELAAAPEGDVRKLAREALEKFEAHGLLDEEEKEQDEPDEDDVTDARADRDAE
ncbi:MAG: hypothetical protein WC709_10015 [Thermoleophilia bacterium]